MMVRRLKAALGLGVALVVVGIGFGLASIWNDQPGDGDVLAYRLGSTAAVAILTGFVLGGCALFLLSEEKLIDEVREERARREAA